MRYRIIHQTQYVTVEPISVGHNEAWLKPRDTPTQRCLSHVLEVSPLPSVMLTRDDCYQNTITQFAFNQGYDKLSVTSTSLVSVTPPPPPQSALPGWDEIRAVVASVPNRLATRKWPQSQSAPAAAGGSPSADPLDQDLAAFEFVFDSPRCRTSPEFAEYARASFPAGSSIRDCLAHLLARFHTDFRYDATATTVSTPVEQVFRHRRGVCQDFAHLLISCLRSLGLPARYVSGYLRTLPPPGKPRLVGADASHAWVSVYCGPHGWLDIDPTNNQFPTTDHITIAWGRDYLDVAPLKGVYIGGSSPKLIVSVDVASEQDPELATPVGKRNCYIGY